MARRESDLFRALLRHQRTTRGLSQLDLALSARTSARHVSFLETGRAQPSRAMVLRLSEALGLSLRETNQFLESALQAPIFPETGEDALLNPVIDRALSRMLRHHEPYPMIVVNRGLEVTRSNEAANRLMTRFIAQPEAITLPLNSLHMMVDPRLMRPFIENWERVVRQVLCNLQREAMRHSTDTVLSALLRSLADYPDVPSEYLDLSEPTAPVLDITFARDGERARFMTTLTKLSAPLDVTLEDLRIESFFPLDDETDALCRRYAGCADG